MSSSSFDPRPHVTRIRTRGGTADYLETRWRLVWLRAEHPDATVRTELVEHDRQAGYALVRAEVSLPDGGSASGYGSQTAAPDRPDYLERAETRALGRALAALGYGTQFAAEIDADRGPDAHIVDAPLERARLAGRVAAEAPAGKVVTR